MTPEQAELAREKGREQKRRGRANLNPEKLELIKEKDKERKRQSQAKMTERDKIISNEASTKIMRRARLEMTEEEKVISVEENTNRMRRVRSEMTEEEKIISVEENTNRMRRVRSEMTEEEKIISVEENTNRMRRVRSEMTEQEKLISNEESSARMRRRRANVNSENTQTGTTETHSFTNELLTSEQTDTTLTQDQQQADQIEPDMIPQLTRHEYLYEGGWANPDQHLHQQLWCTNQMNTFHSKQNDLQLQHCTVCKECWPITTNPRGAYICTRCKRDKHAPKNYSAENNMDPGILPPELQGLSQVEEMLISRACPVMSVYRKHGGQMGYKGHVLNLPQDVQCFLDQLPTNISQLPVIIIRRRGSDNTHKDCRVRRQTVLNALIWLQANNPFYRDIVIDHEALSQLPEDGIPHNLPTMEEPAEDTTHPANEDRQEEEQPDSTSFIPQRLHLRQEQDAIRADIAQEDPLDWPTITGQAMNEFKTEGLATMAFPTLFPFGTGDPTVQARVNKVSLTDAFRHLIRFAEQTPQGHYQWRFASHPRFPY